ncbi:hypothetical protein C8Q77DRAFT_1103941 [Trametes polyzona]|nr:hypothetical protein C8Q77DRAFT_1103941 [Trametes polyzona]
MKSSGAGGCPLWRPTPRRASRVALSRYRPKSVLQGPPDRDGREAALVMSEHERRRLRIG